MKEMTQPIARKNAEHYTWGEQCDGWHLVKAGGLSVIEERMPPGAVETLHLHERATQFFYVLRGQLVIELAGTRIELIERMGMRVEPRAPHRVRNEGPDPVEFLVVSHPPSHGDRVQLTE